MTVTATSTSATPAAGSSPISSPASLAGNFNNFLSLLMTQLKNQDPTSPMDTNAFTSQLVQYASVEQQMNTNGSLTKLIEATQSNAMLQSGSVVGKQVQVASDQIALQSGKGSVQFSLPTAQTVNLGIYSASGVKLRDAVIKATAGDNNWAWDGKDSIGTRMADGAYKVVVADTSGAALSTTTTGTVTGMRKGSDGVSISLGNLQSAVGKIQSVINEGG